MLGSVERQRRTVRHGQLKATINLYKSYSQCGRVAVVTINPLIQHNIRFAPLGTKVKQSKSTQVRFDSFSVS